jgi:hypothetical protein
MRADVAEDATGAETIIDHSARTCITSAGRREMGKMHAIAAFSFHFDHPPVIRECWDKPLWGCRRQWNFAATPAIPRRVPCYEWGSTAVCGQ